MCIHYADVGVFYTGRDWASQGNIARRELHPRRRGQGRAAAQPFTSTIATAERRSSAILSIAAATGAPPGRRTRQHVPRQHLHRPADRHPRRRARLPRDRLRPARLLESPRQVRTTWLPVAPLERAVSTASSRTMDENPLQPMGKLDARQHHDRLQEAVRSEKGSRPDVGSTGRTMPSGRSRSFPSCSRPARRRDSISRSCPPFGQKSPASSRSRSIRSAPAPRAKTILAATPITLKVLE